MRNFVLYRITDGTSAGTVSLINGVDGFWLISLQEEINDWKGGGVWEDSPLGEGRQLLTAEYANCIDRYTLGGSGPCQLPAEDNIRKLEQLLQKADQYWTTRWQKDVVWVERLVYDHDAEAEIQYAVVRRGRLPGLGEMNDILDQRILQPKAGQAVQELLIERLMWQDYRPGGCLEDDTETQTVCFPSHLEFVNGDDGNVNCGSDASLDDLPDNAVAGKGTITVEAWIRADSYGEGGNGHIATKGGWPIDSDGWHFYVNATYGLIGFINCVTLNAQSQSGLDEFSADGEWHHVVMTYDEAGGGLPAARTIYLAIDGAWVTSYTLQIASIGNYESEADEPLIVGNDTTLQYDFDGDIGWARVSSTIQYDPADGDFDPPARCQVPADDTGVELGVIYEGHSATTHDISGNDNDGTISDATWACDCSETQSTDVACNCIQASAQQAWDYAGWSVHDAQPTDNVRAIVETSSNVLVACQDDDGAAGTTIWRTTDGSAPWVSATTWPNPTVDCYAMIEASDGYLYLIGNDTGTGQVECWRSTDDGDNWSIRNNNVASGAATVVHSSIAELGTSGELYVACSTGVYKSTDYGTTWTAVYTSATCYSIIYAENGYLYATAGQDLIKSNDGTSWSVAVFRPSGITNRYTMFLVNGLLLISTNFAGTYRLNAHTPGSNNIYETDTTDSYITGATYDGAFYWMLYANGEIYKSQDAASGTWALTGDIGTGTGGLIYYDTNGYIYAGEAGDIYYLGANTVTAGRSATCTDEVFVANKQNVAQLTAAFVYDSTAAAYTDVFPTGNTPTYLLPNPIVAGDILYTGIDSSVVDAGPFCSLVFDLYQALIASAPAFDIEYSDGGAGWPALNVQDGTNAFATTGVNSVSWVHPSDWATEVVNGVSALWIRFEVTGIGTWVQSPIQYNRSIYTVTWPRVDIDEAQLTGDATTRLRIKANNRSDEDGYESTLDELDLLANRYIIGARGYGRGDLFTAYLNCSDEQNPIGVSTTDGTGTTTGALIYAPTGRAAVHTTTGNGLANWDDAYTIELGPSIARDFYGVHHAYLRAQLEEPAAAPSGDHDDVRMRLKIQTGSGGVEFVTDYEKFVGWDAGGDTYKSWQLLDFGKVTLPVSEEFAADELPDEFNIVIQIASAATTNLEVNLFDVIFIPVDEWAGDFVDDALEDDSGVTSGYLIDIDSVSFQKEEKRALVRTNDASAYIRSRYKTITPSPVVVQSQKDMRLWFLTARGAYLGEHTGAGAAAILTDSYADFIDAGVNEGDMIFNITDGSSGPITAFTETTVTATLTGGAGNDWDLTDEYVIICDHWRSEPYVLHSVQIEGANRFLSVRGS